MNNPVLVSAWKRALRTFIQVFAPGMLAGLTDVGNVSELWVLALATGSAAIAFAWRALWDPSSVPSLADPPVVLADVGAADGSVHGLPEGHSMTYRDYRDS